MGDTIPQTGKLYMVAEPLEECYKPGGLQAKLLPYAYLVLLIYGFGFPMSVGLLFLLFKKKIAADQKLNVHDKGGTSLSNPNYAFRRSCGQLYGVFQPRFYLWSIFLIVRKLLLCAISVMFKENPTYQLAGTLAVVFAAFVLQVKNMPFLDVKERARLMREEAEQKNLGRNITFRKTIITSKSEWIQLFESDAFYANTNRRARKNYVETQK